MKGWKKGVEDDDGHDNIVTREHGGEVSLSQSELEQ